MAREYKIQEITPATLPEMEQLAGITVPKINYGTAVGGKDRPIVPSYITETKITSTTIESPTISAATLNGATIYVPNSTSPLFSVDSAGNVVANSLRRNDFHWFTVFESLDGYSKSATGTISLNPQYAQALSDAAGNAAYFYKDSFYSSWASWDKKRSFSTGVTLPDNSSQQNFIITGDVTAGRNAKHIGFYIEDNTLYAECADGTNRTTTSIQTFNAGATFELKCFREASNSVKFYVNGSLTTTITTNIPTGSINAQIFMEAYGFCSIAATRAIRVGYFDFWQEI
jgi:hypothetical protein